MEFDIQGIDYFHTSKGHKPTSKEAIENLSRAVTSIQDTS